MTKQQTPTFYTDRDDVDHVIHAVAPSGDDLIIYPQTTPAPPWQGGIQTFTVTTDFTMSGSDENNEILIFSGTGGTYHVTLPNPASNAAAHTHYIEVSDMDIVFQCGTGATKLTLAADGKTKKGTMYVAPNVVAGNVKLIEV